MPVDSRVVLGLGRAKSGLACVTARLSLHRLMTQRQFCMVYCYVMLAPTSVTMVTAVCSR